MKKNETYVDTRVRLYKIKKIKSSSTLPPDEDSVVQAILRVHHQVYTWIRSNEINIEHLDFRKCGWKWCEKENIVVPVWFTGRQFPPELSSRKSKATETDNDADDEDENITIKRRRRKRKSTRSPTAGLCSNSKVMHSKSEEEMVLDASEIASDEGNRMDNTYEDT